MYNGCKIIIGLIIFVGLITAPFIFSGKKATAKPDPKGGGRGVLELPGGEGRCVECKGFVRRGDVKLLNQWRDWVVRDGDTIYTNVEGKRYTISLQNTCMKCHSNKTKFCDECHNYAAVSPYCWDCHIAPKEKKS